MNHHIASLHFIGELSRFGQNRQLPPFYREIVQKFDISDYSRFRDFITQELQSGSLQVQNSAEYIDFSARQFLVFQLLRLDKGFEDTLQLVRHRLQGVQNADSAYIDIQSWNSFLDVAEAVYQRLTRTTTFESFESTVDQIAWADLPKNSAWITLVSGLLGIAYMNEEGKDQIAKARIWLDQALKHADEGEALAFRYAWGQYLLHHLDDSGAVADLIDSMRSTSEGQEQKTIAHLNFLTSLDLEASARLYEVGQAEGDLLAELVSETKDFDASCREVDYMSTHMVATMEGMLGMIYGQAAASMEEGEAQEALMTRIGQYFDRSLAVAQDLNSPDVVFRLRLQKAETQFLAGMNVTEKEMKEIVAFFKKSRDFRDYMQAMTLYLKVLSSGSQWDKLYDAITEVAKFGHRQQNASRFYLILSAFSLANEYFRNELLAPGVSWMVDRLKDFFKHVADLIEELNNEEQMALIGQRMFAWFREIFIDFERASHFNIYTYYNYQYQSIHLLKLSMKRLQDQVGIHLASNLLKELDDQNNPLHLIRADWEDFKDVPNAVRNKTLNKCINISKGDLPKAADHLEFSYRNLRSYITFKEVNRLGFFLDETTTPNRQLELGIRYMFHDLYKQGTIFEVVFDMPKFLVDHANSGFYSVDLEEALNIKGTTAKKYIKIMIGIGMIRQQKVSGRKHFYRLQKDEIMKRLGKEQMTLID